MSWKDKFPKKRVYHQEDGGILYCADCLEVLKEMTDNSIDLILTDPPYMISKEIKIARSGNYKYKGKDISQDFGEWDKQWETKEDYIKWCKIWWKDCIRVLKNYKHLLFFFDKAKVSYAWDFMEENGMKGRSPIFWIKSNPVPRARKVDFMKSVEEILWFTKLAVKQKYFNWYLGQAKDYIIDSISHLPRFHPTQKPLKPLKQIMLYLSNQEEIVLDPFAGSGSTLVACKKLKRKWIGIEISEEFCEITKRRLKNVGTPLF